MYVAKFQEVREARASAFYFLLGPNAELWHDERG